MKRRDFLKYAAGSTGLMAATDWQTVLADQTALTDEGTPSSVDRTVPISPQALQARNGNRSTVVGTRGMVSSSQPLAVAAGYDVLKSGGNAVDAAIAVNAMLAVVEPMMCGLGGDLFAIVWNQREGRLHGLNASGRSPYNWSLSDALDMNLDWIEPFSPLAWSVPGCVSGWTMLNERFGSRPLGQLLQPAHDAASEGFPVSPLIAARWRPSPEARHVKGFEQAYLPTGQPRFGDIVRNPGLANTYEIMIRDGSQAFYEGEIADRIVRFSEKHDGRFSQRDFTDHRANWVEPVSTSYRGYDVWELPPNGQGLAVLQMLNILETFDFENIESNSAEHLHLLLEAKKLAFADRAVYYADVDFAQVPVEQLISKDYGQKQAQLIDRNRARLQVEPGMLPTGSETIYLTTADDQGNMVSLIQSIYYAWGSHYVVDDLGICLQNRGRLFSLNENDRNVLAPHKRPFHTIIPAMVTRDGRPAFSFGVTGGDFQPQGQTQVLMNIIDFGMSAQQAGEQPRVWHQDSFHSTGELRAGAPRVLLEPGIGNDVRQTLTNLGHPVSDRVSAFGGYQGIWRGENPRRYFGAADPRKDGCAIGY